MMTTILVVDDSDVVRMMVRALLEEAGYDVLTAEDGGQGLAMAKANAVDFFLIDLLMPGIGGLELTREIRALPQYEKTPLFMLTTEGHGSIAAEGTAAGADAWIVKPFEPERLLVAIERAVTRACSPD